MSALQILFVYYTGPAGQTEQRRVPTGHCHLHVTVYISDYANVTYRLQATVTMGFKPALRRPTSSAVYA